MDKIKMGVIHVKSREFSVYDAVPFNKSEGVGVNLPWEKLLETVSLDVLEPIFLDVSDLLTKPLPLEGKAVIVCDKRSISATPEIIPLGKIPEADHSDLELSEGSVDGSEKIDCAPLAPKRPETLNLETFADLYGISAARIRLGLGDYFMKKKDHSRAAIYLFSGVNFIKLQPLPEEFAAAQVSLGFCCAEEDDSISAISYCKSAIDSGLLNDKKRLMATAAIACNLAKAGLFEQAVPKLQWTLSLNRSFPPSARLSPQMFATIQGTLMIVQQALEHRKQQPSRKPPM